ncbi:MAG: hypothetical protein ACJ8GK_09450 [Luteimonas sp.]
MKIARLAVALGLALGATAAFAGPQAAPATPATPAASSDASTAAPAKPMHKHHKHHAKAAPKSSTDKAASTDDSTKKS